MAKTKEIKVTQVRSIIGRNQKQRDTIRALGLRRMHHTVLHKQTPQIMGMISKVNHLVRVETE
jgi:large subunit ribosomal protein L30